MKIKIFGIYQIQSKIKPKRIYIGSAIDIEKRWTTHSYQLRTNKHHSKKLQRHYNKYGESDLMFSILLRCEMVDLIRMEQMFLDLYRPYFNSRPNANSQLGFRHSEKTKKKISRVKRGSDYWTGRKHKKESKLKMRNAKLGKKASIETKRRLSEVRRGNKNATGNKNRLGVKLSEELKKKISEKTKEAMKLYYAKLKTA